MQHRNLLACALVAIVALLLASNVAGQAACLPSCVHVANVYAPSTVAAGHTLTITVTVSYSLNAAAGQGLIVAILNQTENGKPFRTTANTPGCLSSTESVCFPPVSPGISQGDFTATFTLTAPNQAGTWNLYVFGMVSQLSLSTPDYSVVYKSLKLVQVEVTSS